MFDISPVLEKAREAKRLADTALDEARAVFAQAKPAFDAIEAKIEGLTAASEQHGGLIAELEALAAKIPTPAELVAEMKALVAKL